MKLLSIIIPIYNVEDYLLECVESVCAQTYQSIEIILVDDGSTDKSPQICDELSKRDARIVVIHQENAGGGAARNIGLSIAKGEYIAFVDSDDYISPYMYEKLISILENDSSIDIIECGYVTVGENEKIIFQQNNNDEILVRKFSVEEALVAHINDTSFRQLIWNKVYRRKVLNEVRFPEIKGIDDEFWTYKALGNAESLGLISEQYYAYRQQNQSVMHTLDAKKRLRTLEAKTERHKYIRDKYPNLISNSAASVWLTALYCGQLVYLDKNISNKKEMTRWIYANLRKCIDQDNCKNELNWKQRLWIELANINFDFTCKMRMILKIGL